MLGAHVGEERLGWVMSQPHGTKVTVNEALVMCLSFCCIIVTTVNSNSLAYALQSFCFLLISFHINF